MVAGVCVMGEGAGLSGNSRLLGTQYSGFGVVINVKELELK